jgi:hypothetical protein
MTPTLEALIHALVHEGFALPPYTPDAVAVSMPPPLGIAYPPAYAAAIPGLHDRVELALVARHAPAAAVGVRAAAVFLLARGPRHEAVKARIDLAWHALSSLEAATIAVPFASEPERELPVRAYLEVSAEPLGDGLSRIHASVCNSSDLAPTQARRLNRRDALRRSLLATHVVVELDGATFVSPQLREGELGRLVAGCRNVNTWPVLASPRDDAVLGASAFLPDHPTIPPEPDAESAVSVAFANAGDAPAADGAATELDAAALGEVPGEAAVVVDGATFQRGGKVRLCPQRDDPFDRLLDGRRATVERIFLDFDDRVYLGVTVDDDPARDLFRETGRLLFFFADEVEVISP